MHCNLCLYPPLLYKHPYAQSHKDVSIAIEKSIKSEWRFLEIKKKHHLRMNNINFNPKSCILSFLIKLFADIRLSSFLLDSWAEAKRYFKTFLQVIVSIF